jgi:AcrR family transcriptional regulator
VYTATLSLYGEVGWAGFNLDVLARRARVGKAALYGRWGCKELLIVEALRYWLRARDPRQPVDTGTLRGDLISLARDTLDSHIRGEGLVILRAQIEAKVYPEVFGQAMEEWQRQDFETFRPMVLRAIERGELPDGTSPGLVFDAVIGTLVNHVLWTPASKLPALAASGDRYVESIVDLVLSAVACRQQD